MTHLEKLEKEFGFEYPALYKRLYQSKMLDMGEASADWLALTYPKLKQNPSLLLYACDFELININEVQGLIEEIQDPDDYRNVNPEYLFVPFAMTYGGDWYCFWYRFPTEIEADEPLIVLLPHDDLGLEVLAKNLDDFIFAELCKSVCDVYEEGLIMDGDFRENTANMLRTHLPYLSEERQKIVTELYGSEWFSYTYKVNYGKGTETAQGLITQEDLDALLEKEIGFEYRGERYPFEIEDDMPPIALQKIAGIMYLRFSPIPDKDSAVYQAIKELNWRQNKAITTHLEYSKKYEVFTRFTTDQERFNEMLRPFLTRLQKLKEFSGFQLIFKDEQSGQDVDLTKVI